MKKFFWNEYISLGAMVISIGSLILSMVVPGPQGPSGTPGSNGINGSNGTNGIDGSQGVDGSNGQDGSDGQDGDGIEFQIIDGVMMYRIGEGPWQAYTLDDSTFNFGTITDDRYFTLLETYNESIPVPVNAFTALNRQVIFAPVLDQVSYVNDRLNEGYLPIASVDDVLNINEDVQERYVLTADINFGDTVYTESLIGSAGDGLGLNFFEGTLDGAGFTMSNLILESNDTHVGLFAGLAMEARVGNLTLSSFFVEATLRDETLVGAGMLAGILDTHAYIENVRIEQSQLLADQHAGFIAGQIISEEDPFVEQSSLLHLVDIDTSTLRSPSNNGYALGGFIGKVTGGHHSFVNNSMHQVVIQDGARSVGGFIGVTEFSQVDFLFNLVESVFLRHDMQGENVGFFIGTVDLTFLTLISNSIFSSEIDTPMVSFVGGFIGGILSNFYGFMISNSIDTTTLQGFENIGGFIGGQYSVQDRTFTSVMALGNSSTISIMGVENLGGFAGSIDYGNVVLSSNLIDTTISLGTFDMGGLFGAFNDFSGLLLVGNRIIFRLDLTVSLSHLGDYYSLARMGGYVGRIGENVLVLSAHNRTQLQLSVTFLGDDAELTTLDGMSLNGIGGAFGITSDLPFFAFDRDVFQTTLLLTHRFPQRIPGLQYNMNHYGFGGLIGNQVGEGTILRVHTTLIDLHMEIFYENMPRKVTLTMHTMGGLIGNMMGSTIDLHHVKISFVYRLQSYPQSQGASTWENVILSVFYVGGLIGYTSSALSAIQFTDLHVELSVDLLMSELPLVLGTSYFSLRDVGGLIGYLGEGVYIEGQRAILETYIGVASNILTMADLMNQTSLEEGFLQLQTIAGLIGSNTSNQTNLIIRDTYVFVDMTFALVNTFYEDAFALAIGENLTTSYGFLGVDVYGYTPMDIVYGEGYFLVDFIQKVDTVNAWLALLNSFDASWIQWAYDETSLTLTFFDPTMRLS